MLLIEKGEGGGGVNRADNNNSTRSTHRAYTQKRGASTRTDRTGQPAINAYTTTTLPANKRTEYSARAANNTAKGHSCWDKDGRGDSVLLLLRPPTLYMSTPGTLAWSR